MELRLLTINSGNVRHAPHDGVICTNIKLTVKLTDDPPVMHNGKELVTILDSNDQKHLVDPHFLEVLSQDAEKAKRHQEIVEAGIYYFGKFPNVYFRDAMKWLTSYQLDSEEKVDLANQICLRTR